MSQRKPECHPPPAIGEMPVLPVFFNLKGRTVLMAGDEEGLSWKVDLVAASGANIQLFTELDIGISSERVTQVKRAWCEEDFSGAALAIGTFKDEQEVEKFFNAARKNSIPVNIVDKPDWCDFQFGSIVNRAPVVVSISTAGSAPVLGQLIRSKIEALLPLDLGKWAQAAKGAREKITSYFPDALKRRIYWRQFAEAAFSQPVSNISSMLQTVEAEQSLPAGKVTIVGAGPGAGDLLTLRAVRAMQSADVILFDDLIADEVLDLARREARRMLVGKRGGRASCRQEDINALMVKLAKQGKHVVRLKSGDPMIFGRAGEELATLDRHDISFEVVPGVTAALAAAAALGVSLTHRDCAQGVKFITAHSRHGELPQLDWRACADPATTLLVYMGGRTIGQLADRLLGEGVAAETPVVVMEDISRPTERRVAATLGTVAGASLNLGAPVLIGIGAVFSQSCQSDVEMPRVCAA